MFVQEHGLDVACFLGTIVQVHGLDVALSQAYFLGTIVQVHVLDAALSQECFLGTLVREHYLDGALIQACFLEKADVACARGSVDFPGTASSRDSAYFHGIPSGVEHSLGKAPAAQYFVGIAYWGSAYFQLPNWHPFGFPS
jgi:hypothetical protein